MFKKLLQKMEPETVKPETLTPDVPQRFKYKLADNIGLLKSLYRDSSELLVRPLVVAGQGMAMVSLDGMLAKEVVSMGVIAPLLALPDTQLTGSKLLQYLQTNVISTTDCFDIDSLPSALDMMSGGFLMLLCEGSDHCLMMGLQGFPFRGLAESENEVSINGSKEAFTEVLNLNITMLRRRMSDHGLHFDFVTIGARSRTRVAIVYLDGITPAGLVDQVKERLKSVTMPLLMDATHLNAFLTRKPKVFYRPVGKTERPDVLLSKLCEGRVGIMVNGTPVALYVPKLFHENFQTVDDYAYPPYYGLFMRTLKFVTFFITLLLPGTYVAMGTYHPDLFPDSLLTLIARSDAKTPFPLMVEALMIHIIFEIIREAGVRMPKAIGGAVSIVGALILGDAAVKAGLLTAPMVLIVAITAVGSFVVPGMYEPLSVMRLFYIIAGGLAGIYGITMLFVITLMGMTSVGEFGVPFMAPMVPFDLKGQRDTLYRANWRELSKGSVLPTDMTGSSDSP